MNILLKEVTSSPSETMKFGEKIIKKIPKGTNLIILKGEIGAGKTTLVKGMGKQLGITEEIKSPTYGYKRSYNGMVHYDLYLIKKMKSKELTSLISEELEDNLVIIEWGEKIPKLSNSVIIEIKSITEEARVIEVKLI